MSDDRIDVSLARRQIDSQFPQWSPLPITPVEVDGWDNRTFRLGPELTVRLPSGPWYAQQVDKEQRWLPVLAPQLPLPIPLPVARGEPDAGFPYPWSVYRWLDGELASQAQIDDRAGFASALAGFLTALRRIDATAASMYRRVLPSSSEGLLSQHAQRVLSHERIAPRPLPGPPARPASTGPAPSPPGTA